MLKLINSLTIEKPIREVFAFVCDPCNNSKWNYYVVSVEKINELDAVGAQYLQTRKNDQQKFVIKEYQENERIVMQTLKGERPFARRVMSFSSVRNTTIIEDQIELKLPIPTILSSLFGKKPRKAIEQNLGKLKVLMETGRVILQDGREEHY